MDTHHLLPSRIGSVRVLPRKPLTPVQPHPSATLRRQGMGFQQTSQISPAPAASATAVAATTEVANAEKSSLPSSYVTREARQALFGTGQEQIAEIEATVSGSIPDWVNGALVMNGGGAYHPSMIHMFDGYGLLAKMRVEGGRVWGSQRYIQSNAYKHYAKTGEMRWREFATALPAKGVWDYTRGIADMISSLVLGRQAFTDNASVNVTPLPDGTLIASSETVTAQYRVDPACLQTLEPVHQDHGVPGDLTTAHPKVLRDGTLVNFTRVLPNGGFHVFKQDLNTLKRTEIAYIRDLQPLSPAWVHDSAASERHLVICEMPLHFNLPSLALGTKTPYIFLDWKPELRTRVHVVALDGSGVSTFDAPAFFAFHFANAHEARLPDGSRVLHVDFCMYKDPMIVNDLLLTSLKEFPGKEVSDAVLSRLTIPLDGAGAGVSGRATTTLGMPVPLAKGDVAASRYFEFPCVAPSANGRPYRYVYGSASVRPTNMGNALAKVDVKDGSSIVWHEPGALPGEPVFLPRPGGTEEDDGVLLANLMLSCGQSSLLVLDAKDMAEMARATLPFGIPYRFHGTWLSGHPPGSG